jgi:hypothetical protein
MTDERQRFDRAFELFEMPEPAVARLRDRRDRQIREQRLSAATIGIAVIGVTAFFLAQSFSASSPDRGVGGTSVSPTELPRLHSDLNVSYLLPKGWRLVEPSQPHDLILEAGAGQRLVVSDDVWAGPAGCVPPGSTDSGPRCRTNPGGILDWLWRRDALDVDRFRPIGIDGYDAFLSEIEPAPGMGAQRLLQRSAAQTGGRSSTVVSARPDTRVRLYVLATDRGTFAVSLIAPTESFDAFVEEASLVIASFTFDG